MLSTKISIPNCLVKFENTEKCCNRFQKIWEKFCRNVEIQKTWVILGKKLKKYLKIFKKNQEGVLEKQGTTV